MASAGPAADWARAGMGFAPDAMSADNVVAVLTHFRKSRRVPEASRVAGNLALSTMFSLKQLREHSNNLRDHGEGADFRLWPVADARVAGPSVRYRSKFRHNSKAVESG
jgi:hypothetical protein